MGYSDRRVPTSASVLGSDISSDEIQARAVGTREIGSYPAERGQGSIPDAALGDRALGGQFAISVIGSANMGATPQGVSQISEDRLWWQRATDGYIILSEISGYKGIQDARIGTTPIGSFNMDLGAVGHGVHADNQGHLWFVTDATGHYGLKVGTTGLRAGTDSRMGTQAIGSIPPPPSSNFPNAVVPNPFNGRLWWADWTGNYAIEMVDEGLRAGTDSRIGTTQVGSWNEGGLTDLAFEDEDVLVSVGDDYMRRRRRGPLRAGTNSRIGTESMGSSALIEQFRFNQRSVDGVSAAQGQGYWFSNNASRYPYIMLGGRRIGAPAGRRFAGRDPRGQIQYQPGFSMGSVAGSHDAFHPVFQAYPFGSWVAPSRVRIRKMRGWFDGQGTLSVEFINQAVPTTHSFVLDEEGTFEEDLARWGLIAAGSSAAVRITDTLNLTGGKLTVDYELQYL